MYQNQNGPSPTVFVGDVISRIYRHSLLVKEQILNAFSIEIAHARENHCAFYWVFPKFISSLRFEFYPYAEIVRGKQKMVTDSLFSDKYIQEAHSFI